MSESTYLPECVIQKINEYIPKDRNMKSPTGKCIEILMNIYNNYDSENYYEIDPSEYKTFSEYCLRINRLERIYGNKWNC